ncbi:MAG: transglycosylase SLT domain-containing protein [Candidatus Kaistia colombiensis]|nr:MAG: transglycosylase SLT domain-containing protein [Kaistia sp.]
MLLFCVGIPAAVLADDTASRDVIEARIAYYAKTYGLPADLLRKVVRTESTFNPAARNGPYWGLMQIRHDTAKGIGFDGPATGLLDAETNLIYGGAYLANAYIVAGGNSARAHALYKNGYYYEAKRKRLLSRLIRVPMGETPMLVAGKLVTRPSDRTMLALASPDAAPAAEKVATAKLALAEGAKPEGAKLEPADVVVASADVAGGLVPKPIPRPVVAKPVVEMAEMVVPILPRHKPAVPVQAVAMVEPIKGPVRGLLYATALVPPATASRADFADNTIARPELALASTASSRFAKDVTAIAFASPTAASRLPAAHRLPATLRLASTDDGIRSDAPACCQLPDPIEAAMPLPRSRPGHRAD